MNYEKRFMRNRNVVDQDKINEHAVTIIGVGAIGSQLAEYLGKMGVRKFTLIDPDTVDEVNLSTQGFTTKDLLRPKVQVVADKLRQINPEVEITEIVERWEPDKDQIPENTVIFSTVDSIDTREMIADEEFSRRRAPCLLDGRMGAESLQCYLASWSQIESVQKYRETFFSKEEAFPAPCGSQATIYCAGIAASILCSMYKQWCHREDYATYPNRFEMDIRTLDVLSSQSIIIS